MDNPKINRFLRMDKPSKLQLSVLKKSLTCYYLLLCDNRTPKILEFKSPIHHLRVLHWIDLVDQHRIVGKIDECFSDLVLRRKSSAKVFKGYFVLPCARKDFKK